MSGPRCLTPKLPPGRLADSRARSRGSSRVAQSQHPGTPAHTPARRTRRCSYQKATCLRPLFSLGQTASSARSDGGSYDIATPQTEVRNLGQLGNLSSGVCEHVCPPSAWRVSPVARTAWAEALFSSRATRSSTGSVVALGRMVYSWQAARSAIQRRQRGARHHHRRLSARMPAGDMEIGDISAADMEIGAAQKVAELSAKL